MPNMQAAFRNILYSVSPRAILLAILIAAVISAAWLLKRPGPRFNTEPIPHMLGWYVLTDTTTGLKRICNREGVCRSYPSAVSAAREVK
ncbi:MAG TPA: hypothetical protein VIY49_39695 [Bryobacteraceae bacterium]